MLFLIDYDRRQGRLVEIREFEFSQEAFAKRARLEPALELNRKGIEREVVLLEASSVDALKRTHRRYFASLAELATAVLVPAHEA